MIELPAVWLVAVNVLGWLAIHLGFAWAGTRLPLRVFDPGSRLYRKRSWEREGRFYEEHLSIRSWKDRLPDGGRIFAGGFSKAGLSSRSGDYLRRFLLETCRGELVHWAVMSASVLFFLWNPWWAGLIMVVYGIGANLPCIVAQRYNRIRLARLLSAMENESRDR